MNEARYPPESRALTEAAGARQSGTVKRALAALTAAAFATLVVGAFGSPRPAASLLLGALYTALATVGFAWVERRRSRPLAYAYVAAQLVLGYAVIVVSAATIGAVLLLIVLVSQAVLLLPLRISPHLP